MGIQLFGWYIGRKPEPVERVVCKPIGNAKVVQAVVWVRYGKETHYFHDCKQALAKYPGAEISLTRLVLADGKYYAVSYCLIEVTVEGEP